MKAVIATGYGSPEVLKIQEVEKPTTNESELMVRIHATTVTMGDSEMRRMKFQLWILPIMRLWVGLFKPSRVNIFGMEFSGVVESIGSSVSKFKIGDQVFGTSGVSFGTYAEYITISEDEVIAVKPNNMSFSEATTVPIGGGDALHFLRKGNIQKGEKVLVNGAGGTIGTYAVQLAKFFGAEVTAVDSSNKIEMLKSIGADYVIDYTHEDFTKSDDKYDVIFDVIGKSSYSNSIKSLKSNGRYILANPGLVAMLRGPFTSATSDKKVIFGAAGTDAEDLVYLKGIIEGGELKSVIDKTFNLDQIVEAHRYVDTGEKKGHVVVKVVP